MKKHLLLLITFLLFLLNAINAQSFEWAKKGNNSDERQATSIGSDQYNNVYIVGEVNDYVNSSYKFLRKYDDAGNLLWQDTLHYALSNLITNDAGECYVRGLGKLAKYDTNGDLLWLNDVPNANIKTMALMPGGGVVVSGNNSNGSQPIFGSYTLSGNSTFFMARCDSNGNWLWANEGLLADFIAVNNENKIIVFHSTTTFPVSSIKKLSENGVFEKEITTLNHWAKDFIVDNEDNIYVLGQLGFGINPRKLIVDGVTYSTSSSNQTNTWLIKYDSTGTVQFVKIIKGNTRGESIKLDHNNSNIYVVGDYIESLEVDTIYLSSSQAEAFVCQMDSLGFAGWAKASVHVAHPNSTDGCCSSARFSCLAIDHENNIIACGALTDYKLFDNMQLNGLATGYPELLIAKINQPEVSGLGSINNSEKSFTLFPNPTSNTIFINFKLTAATKSTLTIKNQLGQSFLTKKYQEQAEINENLDMSNYAKGIYFIELLSDEERKVKKVVVN